ASSQVGDILPAGFFLASPYVFHSTPLARVNATALLAAVTGLWLVERPTRWRVALASMAFLAALFTKQTTLDAVVAGTAWLAWRQWRLGVAAVAGLGGGGLLWAAAAPGGAGGAVLVDGGAGCAH